MSIAGMRVYHGKLEHGCTEASLEYEVFPEQCNIDGAEVTVYGITVRKRGECGVECATIADISSRQEFVFAIAEKLSRNGVTPCTAKEVIIDLLSEI